MNLWVIRHAKSSWANAGQADFDRPLNERGNRDGKRLIAWMQVQNDPPQRIISSDAVRARATTDFVRVGFRLPDDRLQFDHRLYEASVETIFEVVCGIPDNCPSAALVGHNPGSTDFVNAMVGTRVVDALPTFGIALLTLPPRWRDARPGCARLALLHSPKALHD